ncbi:hypothetical protein ES705_23820 [subsurface metagenome]
MSNKTSLSSQSNPGGIQTHSDRLADVKECQSVSSARGADMPTYLLCAGATGLRIVQLRPAFSSWGLGAGKPHTTSTGFF